MINIRYILSQKIFNFKIKKHTKCSMEFMDKDISIKPQAGRIYTHFRNTIISGEEKRKGNGIRERSKENINCIYDVLFSSP